ncbi:MAG: winged helix-turn-helix domain-containing protein [archaeon]
MKNCKKIHIWDFPPTKIFVRIEDSFREDLVNKLIKKIGNEPLAVKIINNSSKKYNINRNFSRGVFYTWKKGFVVDRKKIKTKNFPLWVLIEVSKILSNSSKANNSIMKELENNIKYYCSIGGANRIYNPKLPIKITPEFVSIVFHFCGDGHLSINSRGGSSYRQINEETLKIVYTKLKNCFGDFRESINDGRLEIPKSIADIYIHTFRIKRNNWYDAHIPLEIKKLPKEFLVAGLVAFIIDEANIGEIIEIYSKNFKLLRDIREIAIKCGYKCRKIREKYAYGNFDSYRFLISSESYLKLYEDILSLKTNFPFCDLAHKNDSFYALVKRKKRNSIKFPNGLNKKEIFKLLQIRPRTISELARALVIGNSSVRELLWKLEKEGLIKRSGRIGRNILWSIQPN